MRRGFAELEERDRLTEKDLPLLEPDEWVEIRHTRDFMRDAACERRSAVFALTETEGQRDPGEEEDDEEEEAPEQRGLWRIDQGKLIKYQFEYMCLGWNLYAPRKGKKRASIDFTRENREQFVRLHGAHIAAQLAIRGGGISPALTGRVDADGEQITFQEDDGLPAAGDLAAESAAGDL